MTRGAVPVSEVKAPLSIRPNAKAWTSTWSPSPVTDSTWHGEKIASWASASVPNRAVCVRGTRISYPFVVEGSTTWAVAVWCLAWQDDAMSWPPPSAIIADCRTGTGAGKAASGAAARLPTGAAASRCRIAVIWAGIVFGMVLCHQGTAIVLLLAQAGMLGQYPACCGRCGWPGWPGRGPRRCRTTARPGTHAAGTARASCHPGTAPRRSPGPPGYRRSAGSAAQAGRLGERSAGTW